MDFRQYFKDQTGKEYPGFGASEPPHVTLGRVAEIFANYVDYRDKEVRRAAFGTPGPVRISGHEGGSFDFMSDFMKDAQRYRWLRSRDLNAIEDGGVFAGMTPDNTVLNGDDLDRAIDEAAKFGTGALRVNAQGMEAVDLSELMAEKPPKSDVRSAPHIESRIWRHKKTGGLYTVIADDAFLHIGRKPENASVVYDGAVFTEDMTPVIVCKTDVGSWFVCAPNAYPDMVGPWKFTVYQSLWDGQIWVCPIFEFHDGRFINLNVDEVKGGQDD